MTELEKIYNDYLENNEDTAPASVRKAREDLHRALDKYVDALSQLEWECVYKYAVNRE